jgi:hypothetical protein
MTPYLERLLALLESAAQKSPYVGISAAEGPTDDSAAPPYLRLDELLGVPAELFPAAFRLSPDDLALITAALLRLWAAFRLYPDFPENLPGRRRYDLLVGRMGSLALPYFGAQGTYVEFCWYDPVECPFGTEFCDCKNWVKEYGSVGVPACGRITR